MLSRLSVRGKFLAALGVPIVVLFLAATFITWQSVASWRAADQTNSLLGALAAQDKVGLDLLYERAYSLEYLTSGSSASGQQMTEARKQTDAGVESLYDTFDGLNLSALDSKVSAEVSETMKMRESITAVRTKVDDKSVTQTEMIAEYGSIITQGLRVPATVAQTTDDRELAQYLETYTALDSYMNQLLLAAPIEGELLTQASKGQVNDTLRVQAATLATATGASRDAAQAAVDALPSGGRALPEPDPTYTKVTRAIAGAQPDAVASAASQWGTLWQDELASTTAVRDGVRTDTSAVASDSASSARNRALLTAAVTLIVVALSILIAWAIARKIGGPLRRLTAAARNVGAQLPTLVEQVATPGQRPTIDVAPVPVESRDEVGQLAAAFNDVNATTVAVAREQAALRGSIAEMFVNVARRDQVLLNRQLAFLDDLERTEEDPNELSNLFRLDHLATRMRRNAESLLILAGIDSGRRVRQPMPLSDVVRTAASEIELYDRIRLNLGVDPSMLGHNALNAAHLLAELLENATQYSEPHTPVEVTSDFDGRNVNVVIRDSGVGMSDEDRAAATQQANSFSSTDVIGAQRLGLHVVGRLANRLGARISFAPGPDGTGTVVSVAMPIELYVQDSSMPVTAPAAQPAPPQPVPTDQPQFMVDQPQYDAAEPQAGMSYQPQYGAVESQAGVAYQPQYDAAEPQFGTTDQPQFDLTGTPSAALPSEQEPPDAMPVDLDALMDGMTSTGMPKRKTSRADADLAAPSSVVGDQPLTDGIVLPPLATPAFSFEGGDEGWVPPEPVTGAGSLPSRQRGQVPEDSFGPIDNGPSLEMEERTGLFSGFRSMEELDSALTDGTEHISLDSATETGAADFDLGSIAGEQAGAEAAPAGWMADLMGETVSSSVPSAPQAEAYQPVYDPAAADAAPTSDLDGTFDSTQIAGGGRRERAARRALEEQAEVERTAAEQGADHFADGITPPEPYAPEGRQAETFDSSQPYYTEPESPFEEVSPTRENPIADAGRQGDQFEAPVKSFGSSKGSDAPTERIESVPAYEEPPAGYGSADPLAGPFGDVTPVAPGEAPLGEWGAPSPLVRRQAHGPYETEFGEDSVEAHSEWMASAVVFEEMSSLLRRGDSFGAHSAEQGSAYQPERMDQGQSGAGLTRRHRLAGTDAGHDRFTARIERDPEQLRSKLSAFQSATARGRAVADEHQNRPDDVEHVTEPTSHTW